MIPSSPSVLLPVWTVFSVAWLFLLSSPERLLLRSRVYACGGGCNAILASSRERLVLRSRVCACCGGCRAKLEMEFCRALRAASARRGEVLGDGRALPVAWNCQSAIGLHSNRGPRAGPIALIKLDVGHCSWSGAAFSLNRLTMSYVGSAIVEL